MRGPGRAREPHHNSPYNAKNLERRRGIIHMPLGTSISTIIAHTLPSGDGEKMKISRLTNGPRPSFRKTQKHNSITNPPFTWKENLSLVSSGGA